MSRHRVLVAPDSFKGTMSATLVSESLAAGVRDAGGVADLCPVADGGEGALEALRSSVPGRIVEVQATGPDGRPVAGHFLLATDGVTAVVETATASRLHLVDPATVDVWAATSRGTGQLIAAAVDAGATEILLGVGGSGCTDGGLGAIEAIDATGGMRGAHMIVLCDVVTSYENAARIFGPQKGASPETVQRLTERLTDLAQTLPKDPRGVARTGAAGGLAGGLWASYGAELVSGIDTVLEKHEFAARLANAEAVITGEGRLVAQTADGKVVAGVVRWATAAGVPTFVSSWWDATTPTPMCSPRSGSATCSRPATLPACVRPLPRS